MFLVPDKPYVEIITVVVNLNLGGAVAKCCDGRQQTWAAIGERGPLIPLVPLISAHNGNGSGSVRAGRGAGV